MDRFFSWIKNLQPRRAVSLIAIAVGIALILFAKRSIRKAQEAKSTIDHVSDFFTNETGIWDPVIEFFGGAVHQEASKYDITLWTLLTIGIAMVVLGILGFFRHKKR